MVSSVTVLASVVSTIPEKTVEIAWPTVAFAVDLTDSCVASDYVSKECLKCLEDTCVGADVLAKDVGKPFVEAVRASEVGFTKGVFKRLCDYVLIRDSPIRRVTISILDTFSGEHGLWGHVVMRLREMMRCVDPIVKVAFKLFGRDARRVYSLPKKFEDKIEARDHNVLVDACRDMYDALKSLSESLGGIKGHLPYLAEVIGRLVYASDGAYVYSEHMNSIRDFIKRVELVDGKVVVKGAIEAVKAGYEDYKAIKGADPYIESLIDLAEENWSEGRTVFFGITVEAKDHNTLLNALKALEVAIREMEKGLQT